MNVQKVPANASAGLQLSDYQRRIVEFARAGEGHGVIKATAGAGKTSTLVAVAHALPEEASVCFLAFARDAAGELGRRLPPDVPAMTVHKLARRTLKSALERRGVYLGEVDAGKYRRLALRKMKELEKAHAHLDAEAGRMGLEYLLALTTLVRLNLADARSSSALAELGERHGLMPPADPELRQRLDEAVAEIIRAGVELGLVHGRIDFTDMLYLPVVEDFPPPSFDFVCVDEAQDYSLLALRFTMRLVGRSPSGTDSGRLLFVGDSRQTIFGFAGADSDALDRIVRETAATVLPLSITYRCPRSHVRLARLLAPEMEAAPTAADGRVFWIQESVLETWVRGGDLLLCRANAPLVATCLRLARAGLPAYVLGRALADQLKELAYRAFPRGQTEGERKFERFFREEEAKLHRLLGSRPSSYAFVAERLDLLRCLHYLVTTTGGGTPVGELEKRIDELFDEGDGSLALSTVHRAKGKEADRVFILYPELMPAPYARTAEMIKGEACVQFVALTRGKQDLVFVSNTLASESGHGKGSQSSGPRGFQLSQIPGRLRRLLTPARPPSAARPSRQVRTEGALGRSQNSPSARTAHNSETVGQGPGVWKTVLEEAREIAYSRGS